MMLTPHNRVKYRCKFCSVEFKEFSNFVDHKKMEHSEQISAPVPSAIPEAAKVAEALFGNSEVRSGKSEDNKRKSDDQDATKRDEDDDCVIVAKFKKCKKSALRSVDSENENDSDTMSINGDKILEGIQEPSLERMAGSQSNPSPELIDLTDSDDDTMSEEGDSFLGGIDLDLTFRGQNKHYSQRSHKLPQASVLLGKTPMEYQNTIMDMHTQLFPEVLDAPASPQGEVNPDQVEQENQHQQVQQNVELQENEQEVQQNFELQENEQEVQQNVELQENEEDVHQDVEQQQDRQQNVQQQIIEQEEEEEGCPLCPARFDTFSQCQRHVERHAHAFVQRKPLRKVYKPRKLKLKYSCDKCANVNFSSLESYERHFAQIHPELKPFECQCCPFRSTRRSGAVKHFIQHQRDGKFPCGFCSATFTKKFTRARHLREVHRMYHQGGQVASRFNTYVVEQLHRATVDEEPTQLPEVTEPVMGSRPQVDHFAGPGFSGNWTHRGNSVGINMEQESETANGSASTEMNVENGFICVLCEIRFSSLAVLREHVEAACDIPDPMDETAMPLDPPAPAEEAVPMAEPPPATMPTTDPSKGSSYSVPTFDLFGLAIETAAAYDPPPPSRISDTMMTFDIPVDDDTSLFDQPDVGTKSMPLDQPMDDHTLLFGQPDVGTKSMASDLPVDDDTLLFDQPEVGKKRKALDPPLMDEDTIQFNPPDVGVTPDPEVQILHRFEPLPIHAQPTKQYKCPHCPTFRAPFPAMLGSHVRKSHPESYQTYLRITKESRLFADQLTNF